jgi:hypothetical protein
MTSPLIVIYGISGLFKILPTRGICNLRGLARVGYYLEWVVLNNPRMPYNVLSNIPKFLDNGIDETLLPMGYGLWTLITHGANGNVGYVCYNPRCKWQRGLKQQTSYSPVYSIKTN